MKLYSRIFTLIYRYRINRESEEIFSPKLNEFGMGLHILEYTKLR